MVHVNFLLLFLKHLFRICIVDTFLYAVTCENLTSPSNGSIEVSSDGVYTFATVSCDVGFTSSGQASLTCQADGIFDSDVPSCGKRMFSLVFEFGQIKKNIFYFATSLKCTEKDIQRI